MLARPVFATAMVGAIAIFAASPAADAALTWNTAVDHASTTTNQMRSVALGNNSVYIGYIQTTGANNRQVHRHSDASPYAQLNTHAFSDSSQPKALATDDRGNVFAGIRFSSTSASGIRVFDASLTPGTTLNVGSPVLGGLAVHKSGSTYYAYAAYEGSGRLERYDVTNPNAIVLDTTFGTSGVFTVPGAGTLRGVTVAPDGTIFVAQRDAGAVFRISADLTSVTSTAVTRAMDAALLGNDLYVTSYNGTSSQISVLDAATLALKDTITIATLDGNPYARGSSEGWSGIDIDSLGRIWLVDQNYGSVGGTQDRLLISSPIPEPASIALMGAAVLLAMRRRRS